MALCLSPLIGQPFLSPPNLPSLHCAPSMNKDRTIRRKAKNKWTLILGAKKEADHSETIKLVTFLGKGGSGKTTASVFAAQHYAMMGLRTCLVIHSQDPTADCLLGCKIGSLPVNCNDNLSAVRFETTKMILEPLKRLKLADARLNLTQGVLEGLMGEELGILPGMDAIFSALELQQLIRLIGRNEKASYDIVVYDGVSTQETVRMIGATSKARLYLKFMRILAEKTDLGRVVGPSLLRLADDALGLSSQATNLNGKTSSEIWDYLEQTLEKGSSVFADPHKFGCYIVTDPTNPMSINSASRFWGCAIQAGTRVSGAFGLPTSHSYKPSLEVMKTHFSPLPYALVPCLQLGNIHWEEIMRSNDSKEARDLLSWGGHPVLPSSVRFDMSDKSVKLFMPGFDKSEIKLYQFRGGSELLVEAGDQRRVIRLPWQIQGKVGGAKFVDKNLVITMR